MSVRPHGDTASRRPVGRGLVRRDELFGRLGDAAEGGVVLVSAPAGSGKSVLLRSWVDAAGLGERVGWVSVDRRERDAQRFWLAVIDALAAAVPSVERIDPAPSFRGEAVLEQLLADLDSLVEPAVLIIDDLHELDSPEALKWLEVFLARLPPKLGVVLTTREDPQLGLHRLRLAGGLTEIRGPDLRFSAAETKALLREAGIALSDVGVARLYERTEGWAAGLRLAVISLGRHPDRERFVTEFSGSERTVAGYLLAEVLERQPDEVRELLLRTSVLERVSGPLADHLTGGSGSERILLALEDANAFVTSLDVGRTWFRYHHLFADLLQLELRRTNPTVVESLHRAAAEWYESEGHVVEAIRHAQAARDWPLATRLLADHHVDLTLDGRAGTVRQLLAVFTGEAAEQDAELALVFALVRLLDGALGESAGYVGVADRLVETVPAERRTRFDLLRAVVTLAVARWRGDLQSVVEAMRAAEVALEAQPVGERALSDALSAAALLNLGVAELWASRLDDARRHLELALELARRAGRPWLAVSPLGHLAIAGPWTGQSCLAGLALGEEAVQMAEARGWGEDPVILTGLAACALNLLWLGRLDEAEEWLERAQATLHPGGEPGTELIVHSARGLLRVVQGRLEDALTALRAAEQMETLLTGGHAFGVATRARLLHVHARMGRPAAAHAVLAATREHDRETADMRVAEAVIAAAEDDPERALDILAPVLEGAAPTVHRASTALEAQIVDAAAREQLGDERGAEASLERALDLAEREGILLPFMMHPLPGVLGRLRQYRTTHAALRQSILDLLAGAPPPHSGAARALSEELSGAELRVVRYLPSNLKASEIAAELSVSTNTIRTHLRHIYSKLDAHGRAEAVARARELGLLAPAARLR